MITSKEIEHNYIEIGYNKCNMNIAKCFILAILAGMFIAFGGLSSSVASCMIENSSLAKLIQSVVFPAGLAMVVAVGAELFTGDCLITISVLERKANVLKFIRTLIIVYIKSRWKYSCGFDGGIRSYIVCFRRCACAEYS